jgi:hypothetical protein
MLDFRLMVIITVITHYFNKTMNCPGQRRVGKPSRLTFRAPRAEQVRRDALHVFSVRYRKELETITISERVRGRNLELELQFAAPIYLDMAPGVGRF